METVEIKYRNFIKFLQDNIKDNTYVSTILANAPYELFIKKLQNERKTPHEITLEICKKCNINIQSYDKEIINKFERYIQYFQEVSKVVKNI